MKTLFLFCLWLGSASLVKATPGDTLLFHLHTKCVVDAADSNCLHCFRGTIGERFDLFRLRDSTYLRIQRGQTTDIRMIEIINNIVRPQIGSLRLELDNIILDEQFGYDSITGVGWGSTSIRSEEESRKLMFSGGGSRIYMPFDDRSPILVERFAAGMLNGPFLAGGGGGISTMGYADSGRVRGLCMIPDSFGVVSMGIVECTTDSFIAEDDPIYQALLSAFTSAVEAWGGSDDAHQILYRYNRVGNWYRFDSRTFQYIRP